MIKVGWMDLTDDNAQDLDLNLNFKWQLWRVELFGFGMGFKIRPNGKRSTSKKK